MAVTANQVIRQIEGDDVQEYPVAASTRIYQGTLVFGTATGYADDDTGSGVNSFLGVADEDVDNSAGAAGDKKVRVRIRGRFVLTGSSFAQTDVGRPIHGTDNYTVTVTRSTSSVYVGVVREFRSTTLHVVEIIPRAEPQAAIADAGATYTATEQGIINSIIDVLEHNGMIDPS